MRILTLFPGHEFGGAERVGLTLAAELSRGGDEVVVASTGKTLTAAAERGLATRSLVLDPDVSPRERVATAAAAWRLLDDLRPDVVHAHHRWSALAFRPAALRFHIPVVVHAHAMLREVRLTWWGDHTIAVAEAVADHLRDHARPPRRLTVIPNAVPLEEPDTGLIARAGAEIRQPPGPARRLVVLSRLVEGKGLDTLIAALSTVPGVAVTVLGAGPDREHLEALAGAAAVADRIAFLGFVEDPRPYVAAADAVCVPSPAEGLPMSALEGMAQRRPVLATAVGGIPEVVRDGVNGLLCAPSVEGLADGLARLVQADRATLTAWGLSGRQLVEREHGPDVMTRRVRRVLADPRATATSASTRGS